MAIKDIGWLGSDLRILAEQHPELVSREGRGVEVVSGFPVFDGLEVTSLGPSLLSAVVEHRAENQLPDAFQDGNAHSFTV